MTVYAAVGQSSEGGEISILLNDKLHSSDISCNVFYF